MNTDKLKAKLHVYGNGLTVPSFKNRKAMRVTSSGNRQLMTDPKIVERMDRLENATVAALFSLSQTFGSGTPSECSKQLQTFLSGLLDDSIREIPCGEWDVQFVEKGQEGFSVEIEKL